MPAARNAFVRRWFSVSSPLRHPRTEPGPARRRRRIGALFCIAGDGRDAPAWIPGSAQLTPLPAPPEDDEVGREARESVEKSARSLPATLYFHSPFAFSRPAPLHVSRPALIIPASLSCGNASRDGGNAGRDRRIRRSGRRTVECRWVCPEFPTSLFPGSSGESHGPSSGFRESRAP